MSVVSVTDDLRARVREALASAPFDCLLVAQPENVSYVSGYRSVAWTTRSEPTMVALFDRDGTLQLAGPAADAAAAVVDEVVPADHYVAYGRFYFEATEPTRLAHVSDKHDTLADATRELAARVGAQTVFGLDTAAAATLGASVSGDVVDASDWILDLRARKSTGELALLERAARITEQAIEEAAATIEPGISERAIADIVAGHIAEAGGSVGLLVVTSGERSALADTHPTNRLVARGDLIRFDVGCVVDGYWSDLGRSFVVGSASATQRGRYDALHAGLASQLDAVRPGIRAAELFESAVFAVEARGLAPYRRHHCGHAIGRQMYEPPIIAPHDERPLREGMCLCLETPFYELGWGGMIIEDMIVVTEDGFRRLTNASAELASA